MIVLLPDGSLDTVTEVEALALKAGGTHLEALFNDDDEIPVRMKDLAALHHGRAVPRPQLDGLIDATLSKVPGRNQGKR